VHTKKSTALAITINMLIFRKGFPPVVLLKIPDTADKNPYSTIVLSLPISYRDVHAVVDYPFIPLLITDKKKNY
jgi:hypothetical protein